MTEITPIETKFDLEAYADSLSQQLRKARKRNKQLVYCNRAQFALNLIWMAIFIYIWLM